MGSRRDHRNNRVALFDGIEEGGIRASSSYASPEIDEHDNDRAMDGLQDRVIMLKRLTGDIHEEVEGHNRMLDHMVRTLQSLSQILAMRWIHQGESCQGLWINSRWYLRPNPAGERFHLSQLLLLFF
ncbi:bet1-like SNARE 1-1 isoform X1 [Rhododendron vialii]|uniref:bet1-like SNARE 1-1 isoform X1 n=1 Tax=Rhododendron vialii TaxID=182163 RepID=UPI00265E4610|nr:bet1-like SNARE 1-1 isoform X1 [Rhododendron vialii]XP_058188884.1 bet1-like SNARE 1-1 isoform X1 [Rhododendron vialii]XP_058188894.1 bet1-like SNARE 1-1 isoform X1 [Rhododendron vialii]